MAIAPYDRNPRAGHGRGMPRTEKYIIRPQEPSLSDFRFIYAEPNEPLTDEDGAVILWSGSDG